MDTPPKIDEFSALVYTALLEHVKIMGKGAAMCASVVGDRKIAALVLSTDGDRGDSIALLQTMRSLISEAMLASGDYAYGEGGRLQLSKDDLIYPTKDSKPGAN